MIEIPEIVRNKAAAIGADDWIDALPHLVDTLAQEWQLTIGDPEQRARMSAQATGLAVTAIWEWGVVERVSTGLLCTQIDLQPWGALMLRIAEHVAR